MLCKKIMEGDHCYLENKAEKMSRECGSEGGVDNFQAEVIMVGQFLAVLSFGHQA